jgi:uncharacterized protein (TIGR02145 family)
MWISNLPAQESVSDSDNNTYKVVIIGAQVWMGENLKTIKFNDGSEIAMVADNKAWEVLNSPGYCWYEKNEEAYKNYYGALYNWYAVKTGKLCPVGWRVPTQVDWRVLSDYVGGGILGGGKIKETGTVHWSSPNFSASNRTGFTALPAGLRYSDGTFHSIKECGYWWSSDDYDTFRAWFRVAYYNFTDFSEKYQNKKVGISVRCLKN